MGRTGRWAGVRIGGVGLGFLVATGREGGELAFDHGAGMSTAAMEEELKNRSAGHQHAPGQQNPGALSPGSNRTG